MKERKKDRKRSFDRLERKTKRGWDFDKLEKVKEKLEVVWVGLDMLTLKVSRECVWGRLSFDKLERKRGWDIDVIESNEREGFW